MIYVEAPAPIPETTHPKLFLAGGITGVRDWQADVVKYLQDLPILVMNPRRSRWDTGGPDLSYEQIKWEYDGLRRADLISFWFSFETLCPITLYELGAHLMTTTPILVGVDKGYQRRQDIEVQTALVRPEIRIVYTLDDLVLQIKENIF